MVLSRHLCNRCGEPIERDAEACVACGTAVPDSAPSDDYSATTGFLDTIHLQTQSGEPEDERIVRPSLGILYRMAVGPGADYYAPRFLEFERIGYSLPGWNWASLWVPSAWAFYRKLWFSGLIYALWPLAAVALFQLIDPYLGDSLSWLACAVLLVWLIPGVVAALLADTLLFHRARRQVRDAEAKTTWPEDAARLLADRTPIAPGLAILLGGTAFALALYVAAPSMQVAYADRLVRTHIAEVLAAIHPLQRQVEQWWRRSGTLPEAAAEAPNYDAVTGRRGAEFLEGIDVSLASGRVRLALGPLIPELFGKSILLAPTVDQQQQLRWICVPIDIPLRYLPQECKQG